MTETPALAALRNLSAEIEQVLAHEDLEPWARARFARWLEAAWAAIRAEVESQADQVWRA